MLKKPASGVLSSQQSSMGTQPPHRLGGAHRRGAPYSSHRAPQRTHLRFLLTCGLASGLFEHPTGVLSYSRIVVSHQITEYRHQGLNSEVSLRRALSRDALARSE